MVWNGLVELPVGAFDAKPTALGTPVIPEFQGRPTLLTRVQTVVPLG